MACPARRSLGLFCALVAAVSLAGCSRGGAAPTDSGQLVHITERDFHIAAPTHVSSGDLRLLVHNEGPDDHELLIAPLPASGKLPVRSDGITVNEETLQSVLAPSLEPGAPGARRELRLHLRPGRYVFFCNMSGHYMAGMHADVVVQ